MKKIIALALLTVSISSFASAYEEKELAKCNDFTLVKVAIGSLEMGGIVSTKIKYEVRTAEETLTVDKLELVDINVYQFVSNNIRISITESFEFNGQFGEMIFRLNGMQCVSL